MKIFFDKTRKIPNDHYDIFMRCVVDDFSQNTKIQHHYLINKTDLFVEIYRFFMLLDHFLQQYKVDKYQEQRSKEIFFLVLS